LNWKIKKLTGYGIKMGTARESHEHFVKNILPLEGK